MTEPVGMSFAEAIAKGVAPHVQKIVDEVRAIAYAEGQLEMHKRAVAVVKALPHGDNAIRDAALHEAWLAVLNLQYQPPA